MTRIQFLQSLGADLATAQELIAYNGRQFDVSTDKDESSSALLPEPHIKAWRSYADEAERNGVFTTLQRRLVQLQFPIRAGISQTKSYLAATRRGVSTDGMIEASGLELSNPDKLELKIHDSLAGPIPVLIAAGRDDFVALLQALTSRNEPVPIPDSMGAMMVANFNNWDRILTMREKWHTEHPNDISGEAWECEFRHKVIPNKTSYQDKFIILSDGSYSGVAAAEMGLTEVQWRELSRTIRLEHECTHYFTRRCFGSAQNHILDELVADYRGITVALGRFRADWFLRFMGLEKYPSYRNGGRLEIYRGDPPLSSKAFGLLRELVKRASENVERFDHEYADQLQTSQAQRRFLFALCRMRFDDLTSGHCMSMLSRVFV
jgi:hypothetical protein